MGMGGLYDSCRGMTFGDFLAFTLYLGIYELSTSRCQILDLNSPTVAFCRLVELKRLWISARAGLIKSRNFGNPVFKGYRFWRVSLPTKKIKKWSKEWAFCSRFNVTLWWDFQDLGKTTIARPCSHFLNPWFYGKIHPRWLWFTTITLESFRFQISVVLRMGIFFWVRFGKNISFFPRALMHLEAH